MVHLTKLEFFEQGYGQLGLELGIIPAAKFEKFIHYTVFQGLIKEGYNKTNAVEITAEKTNASFSRVWRNVHYFM